MTETKRSLSSAHYKLLRQRARRPVLFHARNDNERQSMNKTLGQGDCTARHAKLFSDEADRVLRSSLPSLLNEQDFVSSWVNDFKEFNDSIVLEFAGFYPSFQDFIPLLSKIVDNDCNTGMPRVIWIKRDLEPSFAGKIPLGHALCGNDIRVVPDPTRIPCYSYGVIFDG